MPFKKRVLIADDHALLAEGVRGLLSEEHEVVGISANGRQLLADAMRLQPDLIILDVSMPELNGIEAATQLGKLVTKPKMIFLTQRNEPQYVKAAFRAGASGYVTKQSVTQELKTAVKAVLGGLTFISPSLQEAIGFAPVSSLGAAEESRSGGALTNRQREVLHLIAEGKTAREIAEALSISIKTVEFHKRALVAQTGLRTTADLIKYAIAHGITAL